MCDPIIQISLFTLKYKKFCEEKYVKTKLKKYDRALIRAKMSMPIGGEMRDNFYFKYTILVINNDSNNIVYVILSIFKGRKINMKNENMTQL